MGLIEILFILALILCFLYAIGVSTPRVHLGWLGVTTALLAYVLGGLAL
jgi:hypothetical protein